MMMLHTDERALLEPRRPAAQCNSDSQHETDRKSPEPTFYHLEP
jgi:hypothetical protein